MEHSLEQSIFVRTDGDGMESAEVIKTEPSSSVRLTPNFKRNEGAIVNVTPKNSLEVRAGSKGALATSNKTPKFIPYEPYKAAVKPILPHVTSKKSKSRSESVTSCNEGIVQACPCSCKLGKSSESEKLTKLESEISKLNSELKIQSQVNAELKKLLVASVGEDIQARVQFLTEDKAKLAVEIRKYVEKVAVDFEEKEKLSIEGDIWRSKFLASSVVIEELAKWKAVLCQRSDDLQNCIKILIGEINSLRDSAVTSIRHLRSLNVAFDPLGTSAPKSGDQTCSDALEAALLNTALAKSLADRLLGTYTQTKEELEGIPCAADKPTPGQLLAEQLLMTQPTASCLMSDLVSAASAQQVAALANRSMNKSLFACCSHCKGDVHIV